MRGGEEVLVGVRERHEPPAALAELGERARHLGKDRPRGQRVAERVRLALRKLQPLALGEQDERLAQDLAVGSEPSSCTRGSISW